MAHTLTGPQPKKINLEKGIFESCGIYYFINFDGIEYFNDKILLTGNIKHDNAEHWSAYFILIDTIGEPIWSSIYSDTLSNQDILTITPCYSHVTNDGHIITPLDFFQTNSPGIAIYDTLGNIQHIQKFQHNEFALFPRAAKEYLGEIYLFGRVQRLDYYEDVFVIKSDESGKLIWFKFFGAPLIENYFGDIASNRDGTFTISSRTTSNTFITEQEELKGWAQPWIFTIDTAGTIVDQWTGSQHLSDTYGGSASLKTKDGGWIFTGSDYVEKTSGSTHLVFGAPTILRLDSNYNLIWKHRLSNFEGKFDILWDLEYDSVRQEYVAAGNYYVDYGTEFPESEAWIIKFKDDGEILWNITDTLLYNIPGGEAHYTAGLTIAPSGSIYVAGYVRTYKDDGWIIKVTPDGCSDTICTTTSIFDKILRKDDIFISPNPVIDEMKIKLPETIGATRLDILDIHGRKMEEHVCYGGETKLITQVPAGIYFFRVIKDGIMVGSGKFVKL